MTSAYEPDLVLVIERAVARLRRGLADASLPLAAAMERWLDRISGSRRLVEYFTHLRAFPMLLFPWWMEDRLRGSHDPGFQEDLAYSTVCGYLHIRLIDNIMDEPDRAEIRILPLASYLHSRFQSVYHEHFPPSDPFWAHFHQTWMQSAEASLVDAGQESIDERRFLAIASRKTCAGKIPLAAVCRRDRTAVPPAWMTAFDRMAAVHQFCNDLFDFQRDLDAGRATYFLSEGMRRRRAAESMAGWVIREGFDWGVGLLDAWLGDLAARAEALGSPGFARYVALRLEDLRLTSRETREGLQAVKGLLEPTP